jgi:predicted lipoprotein with Yx(FWY)xxD motif
MIKEVTMYTIVCDRCGVDACEGQDYSAWSDIDGARESTTDGWLLIEDKDYCENCQQWNDDESQLIPKP